MCYFCEISKVSFMRLVLFKRNSLYANIRKRFVIQWTPTQIANSVKLLEPGK